MMLPNYRNLKYIDKNEKGKKMVIESIPSSSSFSLLASVSPELISLIALQVYFRLPGNEKNSYCKSKTLFSEGF